MNDSPNFFVTVQLSTVAYRGGFGVFKAPPKFRSFDKAAFDCKLSGKMFSVPIPRS